MRPRAHPRGGACLSLGHQVLRAMPALTWGSPHATEALAEAEGVADAALKARFRAQLAAAPNPGLPSGWHSAPRIAQASASGRGGISLH